MENKSSNGWKFFALLFGGLLAALVGLYIYDLGLNKAEDEADDEAKAAPAEA